MSVRDIEARLASTVEDKVSQRLGYRETRVWLPSLTDIGEEVNPRPKVKELNSVDQKRAFSEALLMDLAGSHRPSTLFKVEIPRTYPPEAVRVEGVWHLQSEGEALIEAYPLSIERTDARWIIILSPQRGN